MEIVRNTINISGIAAEKELPDKLNGQMIQYSETETIFCPENQPEIVSIFQIIINIDIKNSRKIITPMGYTMILDGVKKIKIIYTYDAFSGKILCLLIVVIPCYIKGKYGIPPIIVT